MKQKTDIQRAFITVLVLVVTLTGCGASSDSTTSTETTLTESPLCSALEANLEEMRIPYPSEVDLFLLQANPSYPEGLIAEWFCEMSERFPAQMNIGDQNQLRKTPIEWLWGNKFLLAHFKKLVNYDYVVGDYVKTTEGPWGNPNTYVDDVFPGCEPGLGLRTTRFPKGILRIKDETQGYYVSATEFLDFPNSVAPGAIQALKYGTFSEYRRAVTEEWKLTFASELLYPPWRADPPNGATQIDYLFERFSSRLIDAGNLLYIKIACPEIWAELDAGLNELSGYLDSLSLDLGKPELITWDHQAWPTHRGVQWSQSHENSIYVLIGCNFERLAYTSTLKTDAPEEQGYLGFECGVDPDKASLTLKNRKYFAGPSFVYVYNERASRDVAVQRHKASDYDYEYNVAFCGQFKMGTDLYPHFVAYFKSADVVKDWQVFFWTSEKNGYGYTVEQIPEKIKEYDFREC